MFLTELHKAISLEEGYIQKRQDRTRKAQFEFALPWWGNEFVFQFPIYSKGLKFKIGHQRSNKQSQNYLN